MKHGNWISSFEYTLFPFVKGVSIDKSSIHGHVWFPEGWNTAGTTDRKHQEFGARRWVMQTNHEPEATISSLQGDLPASLKQLGHCTPHTWADFQDQMWEQQGMFCQCPKPQGPKVLAGIPSSQADSRLPHRRRNLQASAQTRSQLWDLSMFSLGQPSKCRAGATKED